MAQGLRAADRLVAPTASYARAGRRATTSSPALREVVHNGRTPAVQRRVGRDARTACSPPAGCGTRARRADLLDRVAGAARRSRSRRRVGRRTPRRAGRPRAPARARHSSTSAALARRLAARPVFVSAASFEPFGLAVLEAAQRGLRAGPVRHRRLSASCGTARRCSCAGNDDRGLRRRDRRADRRHRACALRLGEAARARAATLHARSAMADGMLAIYRELSTARAAAGRAAA